MMSVTCNIAVYMGQCGAGAGDSVGRSVTMHSISSSLR